MIITLAQPSELPKLIAFREEAASWLRELGTDQWSRPYPRDLLLASIEAGTVFMVRDGEQTAATITLTPDPEEGLWTEAELSEPSMFVNKLTVARTHAGQSLGARLLNWAGDRAHRASAKWLRLDAWTTNEALQRYYVRQGFDHVRTVREGGAVNGGPRVSGWLAQRPACRTGHGFADETPAPEPVPLAR
ncbi:GNAT family N-acetyltransferase [Streptomyces sp. PRKS01-29]|nr:GNAT family N-acetyltransferase [Streptomyces sabulosicollis]MBI0299958.1 GNAT family N-acetyltransferase [Streptomyces sabulosicollis]